MSSIDDNESTETTDSYDDIFDEDVPEKPQQEKPISSRWDLQESWADLEEATPTDVQKGDILPGTVVAVQDQYIVVDVGAKFEGMVPRNEFAEGEELPAEGNEIRVAVVRVDDEAGQITLSKKRADYEQAWEKLYRAQQNGEVLTGMVTDRVKGGLRVDVGMPGFVPASHVAIRDVRKLGRPVIRLCCPTAKLSKKSARAGANRPYPDWPKASSVKGEYAISPTTVPSLTWAE